MFDFLAEYMLLAFALGGILGAVVASHLTARYRRPAIVTRREPPHARANDLATILSKDRTR